MCNSCKKCRINDIEETVSKKYCKECYSNIERKCKSCNIIKHIGKFNRRRICYECFKQEQNERTKQYQKKKYKTRMKKDEIYEQLKKLKIIIEKSSDDEMKEEIEKNIQIFSF
jgi:hypothetical protein